MNHTHQEKVVWEAEFNPQVTTYWLLSGGMILAATVVGLPLVPLWFIVGGWATRRYLASYACTLTHRTLKFRKGILVKQEKTVPLDRITDLGLVQGPIMRLLKLEALSVETAGQSSQGSLIQLTGIKDGRAFRDAVLKQRDLVVGSDEDRRSPPPATAEPSPIEGTLLPVLQEISETLRRIETRLIERNV